MWSRKRLFIHKEIVNWKRDNQVHDDRNEIYEIDIEITFSNLDCEVDSILLGLEIMHIWHLFNF